MATKELSSNYGVLIISHGSKDEKWVKQVDEAIAPLKQLYSIPIEPAFLELVPGRLIQDGIDRLEALGITEMVVIPLFISSGSSHIEELHQAFHVQPASREKEQSSHVTPYHIRANVKFGTPMDASPYVVDILYEHFVRLQSNAEDQVALIIGHGSRIPGCYDIWEQVLQQIGASLQAKGSANGSLQMVKTAMLTPNQVPEKLAEIQMQMPHARPIVLPLFLSEGYFTKVAIPDRLQGHSVRYDGRTLLPNARITQWLAEQIDRLCLRSQVD